MINDDTTPEELDAWYRRTPDQIAAEKAKKWNADWAALRTPDDQAYEPEHPAPTGDAIDAAARVRQTATKRVPPPEKTAWANHELGFLDVLASGETNEGDGGYDVLATQPGHPRRRLAAGADGKPDYSRFPDPLRYPDGRGGTTRNSSAGRYQFKEQPWKDVVKAHPDVTDIAPLNQNKAAWYLAMDTYRQKTGRDLSADLKDERYWPQITDRLNGKWSSLPGGAEPQMTHEEFDRRLRDSIARYGKTPSDN